MKSSFRGTPESRIARPTCFSLPNEPLLVAFMVEIYDRFTISCSLNINISVNLSSCQSHTHCIKMTISYL